VFDHRQRAFALVGPGRAGTTLAAAMAARGWRPIAVAGRAPGTTSVLRAAELLGAPAREVGAAGIDADVVLIATPDAAIAETAGAIAPSLRSGALVLHLSGACTLDELHKLRVTRPDVELGSLHPLQSLPSVDAGLARLPGSWCAVDGPPEVERLAVSLGMRPVHIRDADRVAYHAAATVASNHLVALLGQAARIADSAGVPPAALLPLVRATIDNVEELGPEGALTGPVARGDVDTVLRHLDALPDGERAAYCALAEQALRLTGRDDHALRHALEDHA
jgi:predicted short-subunit dehydrogenase-like oxidoreductase (DUF2520 family)